MHRKNETDMSDNDQNQTPEENGSQEYGADSIKVLKGLEAGEKVVIEGNHLLRSELMEDVLHQAHHAH